MSCLLSERGVPRARRHKDVGSRLVVLAAMWGGAIALLVGTFYLKRWDLMLGVPGATATEASDLSSSDRDATSSPGASAGEASGLGQELLGGGDDADAGGRAPSDALSSPDLNSWLPGWRDEEKTEGRPPVMQDFSRLFQLMRESRAEEEQRLFDVDVRAKKTVSVTEWYTSTFGATMIGHRPTDEDALLASGILSARPDARVKAVFDGHGGDATSRYCAHHIAEHLGTLEEFSYEDVKKACLSLDAKIIESFGPSGVPGSTGLIVVIERVSEAKKVNVVGREIVPSDEAGFTALEQLLQEEEREEHPELLGRYDRVPDVSTVDLDAGDFLLTTINIGDSRGMLIHGDGGFTRLSKDHKPNHREEIERIEKAGGFVRVLDVPRVDGTLALSRAFGDSDFKANSGLPAEEQKVVAVPEVRHFYARPSDLLLMACDGLFEPRGMDWKHVRDLVVAEMEVTKDLEEVTIRLLDYALDMNSLDNISVIMTAFLKAKVTDPQISYKNISGQGKVVPVPQRDGEVGDAVVDVEQHGSGAAVVLY